MSEQNTEEEQTNGPSAESQEAEPGQEGQQEASVEGAEGQQEASEPETFPRDYVERLRDENAKYRQRAQRADELATRLHTALAAADGRLADPTDLDYADEHLEDAEALHAAVEDLLARKPHLAARKPHGSIGQGAVSGDSATVDLAGLLRAGAN